jgi:hypothetical protein
MKRLVTALLMTALLVIALAPQNFAFPEPSNRNALTLNSRKHLSGQLSNREEPSERWCSPEGDCLTHSPGFLTVLAMKITFQMQNAKYPQFVTDLSRLTGKDITFTADKPDSVFNADSKKAALWDVLSMLSDRGAIQIQGYDFEQLRRLRKRLLSDEKLSLSVQNTPLNIFVNDMAALTGLPLRIANGNPLATLTIKLSDVTLNDILIKASQKTRTKIVEETINRS